MRVRQKFFPTSRTPEDASPGSLATVRFARLRLANRPRVHGSARLVGACLLVGAAFIGPLSAVAGAQSPSPTGSDTAPPVTLVTPIPQGLHVNATPSTSIPSAITPQPSTPSTTEPDPTVPNAPGSRRGTPDDGCSQRAEAAGLCQSGDTPCPDGTERVPGADICASPCDDETSTGNGQIVLRSATVESDDSSCDDPCATDTSTNQSSNPQQALAPAHSDDTTCDEPCEQTTTTEPSEHIQALEPGDDGHHVEPANPTNSGTALKTAPSDCSTGNKPHDPHTPNQPKDPHLPPPVHTARPIPMQPTFTG